jgi:predicted metal-binding protein
MENAGGRHILYVCRTCPRYERLPPPGELTRGMMLVAAVRRLGSPLAGRYRILAAHCLNGCPAPCNIVLAAPGKSRLRFHRLSPEHAASVVEVASLYCGTVTGEIARAALPVDLRDKLAASVPPLDQFGRPLPAE